MKIAQVSGFGDKIWGQQRPDVLDIPGKGTCGGGEAALLRTSFELARRGHAVTVYYPGEAATYRGVTFQPVSAAYASLKQGNADVVVAWSDGIACRFAPPGALRVFAQQLNDMPADDEFWRSVDLVISPSKSHLDYLFDRFVPEAYAATRRAVVPNGIDDRYSNRLPWAERPRWAAYWSSPDRGLHHLLRIWPDVIKAVPDAQLHVFYRLRDYVLGGRDFFAHPDFCWRARVIDRQLRDLPSSVILHDAVSRTALAYWQNRARVYAYPLDPVTYTEGFCHPAGTLIETREGLKPIESLTLQDCVLTHTGRWKRITRLRSRYFSGNLVVVTPACGERVEMTPDHPVLLEEKNQHRWRRSEQVRPGDWLYSAAPVPEIRKTVPIPKRPLAHPGHNGTWSTTPRPPLSSDYPLTSDLCRFIGYIAGDGSVSRTRGKAQGQIKLFAGSDSKPELLQDFPTLCARLFGVTPNVTAHPQKRMTTFDLYHPELAHALRTWIYAPDGRKRLPEWAMTLPDSHVVELLKGLWRTDGSVYSARRETHTARIAAYTSQSALLIGQVRVLLRQLGYRVKVNARKHLTGATTYMLQFSIAESFLDYARVMRRDCISPTFTRPLPDGNVALKLRTTRIRPFDDLVYSIDVEGDHSYHVGNFVVHNCIAIGEALAAGCHVVARPVDAVEEVYGDAVEWVRADFVDANFLRRFTAAIVKGLLAEERPLEGARFDPAHYGWDVAVDRLLEAVKR